ncbi:protein gamete expressed 1 [Holotrichia oblita]|uniref:Protein gamete expressed 1 n=1 Tax=Holotrichia oblita TaxID=644536 RepID=A0ACB9SQ21_HOLOL|nr:protein gamete expressed 1 [Holotrichia oblita]
MQDDNKNIHLKQIGGKMNLKILQSFICYLAYVIAFEDLIYVYGQGSQEMQEQGRQQYQLLQERGNLPQYGNCWKSAIRHVNEGCRSLSEDTQAEISLQLTNCFLLMSGHDTYECELNKKPNLRAICINSMSDRAFNVYTEFYTHTQNICWFLRGQIWHETIAENTWKVGEQLYESAKNQEQILQNQRDSLELQERLMKYSHVLEKNMAKFYESSKDQQEILKLFSTSISNLQSWLLGEISWFDTLVFYIVSSLFVIFFTSVPRTNAARLIMLTILTLNTFIERLVCYLLTNQFPNDIKEIQADYYFYIWCSRYICMFINVIILIMTAISYKNAVLLNMELLNNIYDRIINISKKIDFLESKSTYYTSENLSYISGYQKTPEIHYLDPTESDMQKDMNGTPHIGSTHEKSSPASNKLNNSNSTIYNNSYDGSIRNLTGRKKINNLRDFHYVNKYNLRSRNGTPEINV